MPKRERKFLLCIYLVKHIVRGRAYGKGEHSGYTKEANIYPHKIEVLTASNHLL